VLLSTQRQGVAIDRLQWRYEDPKQALPGFNAELNGLFGVSRVESARFVSNFFAGRERKD
jgi:hypothetical protein